MYAFGGLPSPSNTLFETAEQALLSQQCNKVSRHAYVWNPSLYQLYESHHFRASACQEKC